MQNEQICEGRHAADCSRNCSADLVLAHFEHDGLAEIADAIRNRSRYITVVNNSKMDILPNDCQILGHLRKKHSLRLSFTVKLQIVSGICPVNFGLSVSSLNNPT